MKNLMLLLISMLLLTACYKNEEDVVKPAVVNNTKYSIDTIFIKAGNTTDYKKYYLYHVSRDLDTSYTQTITDKQYFLKVKYYSDYKYINGTSVKQYNIFCNNDNKSEQLNVLDISFKLYKYNNYSEQDINGNYYNYFNNTNVVVNYLTDRYLYAFNNKYLVFMIAHKFYYLKVDGQN